MSDPCDSTIGVLLSGGLDSCILVAALLKEGRRVRPLYVRSGLVWEPEELGAVRRWLEALRSPRLEKLVVLDLPLTDLYQGHWSLTGRGAPDAASADDAVYLPGRNALLMVKPALWCKLHGVERLALGVLASNPFADATAAFFELFESAWNCGAGSRLEILRPFTGLSKQQVMELGRGLPLELTFSCIAPSGGLHCGRCNKCAERTAAFRLVGVEDPTRYAVPAPVSRNGASGAAVPAVTTNQPPA
jgi:7-cyano-7-deazaguanine synthase